MAFTSIESLNFPETSPQLLELSLRLANAPAFSNPLNLLKLGQKLTHWLIGPIDSLAGSGWCYCLLMFVDVCCELLCLGFEFLAFWTFMQVWSAIFFKGTWPPGLCHPFWKNLESQRSKDGEIVDNYIGFRPVWIKLKQCNCMVIFVDLPFFCGLFGLVSHDDDSTSDLHSVCSKGRILESLWGWNWNCEFLCPSDHYLQDHARTCKWLIAMCKPWMANVRKWTTQSLGDFLTMVLIHLPVLGWSSKYQSSANHRG